MSNDALIKQYRNKIDNKRKEIGEKPKVVYATNASLETPDGIRINLNLLQTEEQCVKAACDVLTVQKLADEANKILGTSVVPKFGNYTCDQWIADIKQRVQVIKWESENKKLIAMDKNLADLMSHDAKTAEAIANIAAELDL